MKTRNQTLYSSCLDLTLPDSWDKCSQGQLRYIFLLQSQQKDMQTIKIMFLLRMAGIQPVRQLEDGSFLVRAARLKCRVTPQSVAVALSALDWMDEQPSVPVRLEVVDGVKAVDAFLHGVAFGDYLMMDNYYQGYLASKEEEDLLGLAQVLYPGLKRIPSEMEAAAILWWVISLKVFFARKWNELFSPAESGGETDQESLMNAMIRALTAGDVLKEKMVLEEVEVWRALTELNEKAREYRLLKENTK